MWCRVIHSLSFARLSPWAVFLPPPIRTNAPSGSLLLFILLPTPSQAWHNASPLVSSGRDNALRAKATVDRVLRLAADYSDSVMKVGKGGEGGGCNMVSVISLLLVLLGLYLSPAVLILIRPIPPQMYCSSAADLGKGLGVPPHMATVFGGKEEV